MSHFTWNTKKNANGTFTYFVKECSPTNERQENGCYSIDKVVKTGTCKTRSKAKSQGVKWMRYLKGQR